MSRESKASESFLAGFFRMESSGGILLMVAATLAVVCANSPLHPYYDLILDTPVQVRIGALDIAKPLLLWINDGLMAVFFFLVGLELKRELIEGELSDRRNIILPGLGAIGGMVVPALVYIAFNFENPVAMDGWAIPAATDIAFALGILSLLGSRVPTSIKVFLTSLAIFDDIGAIVIIAMFYTAKISYAALAVVVFCLVSLFAIRKANIESKSVFVFFGAVMWVAMLKSGVHATLAGVLAAMFIPMRSKQVPGTSPLRDLEHDLHSVVAFLVLPIFAFANSGIRFAGMGLEQTLHDVPIGIALGLFLGKQIGIFAICWAGIRLKLTQLPAGMSWGSLYGTALLCGVGFTMSLFIGSLAFEENEVNMLFDERLGIIAGSLASGIAGYLVLSRTLPAEGKKS